MWQIVIFGSHRADQPLFITVLSDSVIENRVRGKRINHGSESAAETSSGRGELKTGDRQGFQAAHPLVAIVWIDVMLVYGKGWYCTATFLSLVRSIQVLLRVLLRIQVHQVTN